jgi:glycosyltransferase involved in cell wall biosynthesis
LVVSKRDRRNRPIRVCYPFIGNNVGGSHISTLMLVRALDRHVVEPLVVLHEVGPLADYVRQQGLDYELLGIPAFFRPPYWSFRNVAALLRQTWRIATFLRERRIDFVHANDVRIHFGWTLATRLAGAKLIWHQRTGSFGTSTIKLLLALLSHRVVCISRYTASTLPKSLAPLGHIVANPFETRFAGLDRSEAKAAIIRQLDLAPATKIIGFFGNLVQQKRPAVFLRAVAKLKEHHEGPLAFLLFGTSRNNANADLTRLAEDLDIGDDVHLMGFRAPVEPWMAGCDLVIAPGIGEGLGRSLVEAMIVGTPVIAADSGGHKEVIDDGRTGFLVAADDPDAFAATAHRVLGDADLARKAAELAQGEALQRYSIERHAREIAEVYTGSRESIPEMAREAD